MTAFFLPVGAASNPRPNSPRRNRPDVTVTEAGFTVHDANGRIVAYREHFEEALEAQREIEESEDVRRVSDGAVCATKYRLQGECFWSSLWDMKREPGWDL
jgi:hypothetical protein